MKIALVSPYSLTEPGGVQAQVRGLAGRLREAGHEALVTGPGGDPERGEADAGRWVRVPVNRSAAPVALGPSVFRRVREAVEEADVVHIHEPLVPAAGWAALRADRPRAVTFHADPSRTVRRLYRWAAPGLRRLLSGAAVSAVSPTARRAAEMTGARAVVIPNGLDVESFRLRGPRHPRQVAFIGRPDPRKGRDLLLEAWPAVRRRVPDARLVVIGGGEEPETPGVEFLGRAPEERKRAALAASAVFCAPNRGGESFGITLAEGMAAGCAVAASDLGAFADVLGGGGLLFRTGDRRDLVRALVRLLTDDGLREGLAAAASRRVEDFSWDKVAARYLELYQRALEGGWAGF